MERATLREPVSARGLGVASGREVSVRLEPADEGFGLRVFRRDCGVEIPLHIDFALDVPNCTAVAHEGEQVRFVEHLMSALAAFGITDLRVVTDGPEIPIFDGSAAQFCAMICQAGVRRLGEPAEGIVIVEPVVIEHNGRSLQALAHGSAAWCEVTYHLDHPHPLIGQQQATLDLPADAGEFFASEIAPARTFLLEEEARALQETGWLSGGTEENAIVIYDDHYSAAPKLEGEFARHKILDLLGDLYLLNRRVVGRIIAHRTGHAQNRQLARRIREATP
ncbi:MAG TPA: UDP-3-O-acyl-N-acetylglucosamine deacetylase [Planctomycetota bacterium]|nr:UDP-3-O-acyl-N-acetylglucosamine deacetylase [Planctomycetota bacterium]